MEQVVQLSNLIKDFTYFIDYTDAQNNTSRLHGLKFIGTIIKGENGEYEVDDDGNPLPQEVEEVDDDGNPLPHSLVWFQNIIPVQLPEKRKKTPLYPDPNPKFIEVLDRAGGVLTATFYTDTKSNKNDDIVNNLIKHILESGFGPETRFSDAEYEAHRLTLPPIKKGGYKKSAKKQKKTKTKKKKGQTRKIKNKKR
jgi:hypothetical protein